MVGNYANYNYYNKHSWDVKARDVEVMAQVKPSQQFLVCITLTDYDSLHGGCRFFIFYL